MKKNYKQTTSNKTLGIFADYVFDSDEDASTEEDVDEREGEKKRQKGNEGRKRSRRGWLITKAKGVGRRPFRKIM